MIITKTLFVILQPFYYFIHLNCKSVIMQKISVFLIAIIFVHFLTTCTDPDPLKLPTDITFTMDINREENSQQNLVFTKGIIILASFDFEGERELGEDIYFSKSFPSGLNVIFDETNAIAELDFDIPQGVYNRISIAFETFDDFEQNCLVVEGVFTNTEDVKTPVKFEFNSSEYFEIVAEDYSGNNQIVLNTNVSVTAKIVLDPIYWFQTVNYSMLEDAELTTISGKPTILVNENTNTNMFELIVGRIDESTECIFN